MDMCVRRAIASCVIATIIFDLWMSKCGYDVLCMVVNLINMFWTPSHVTIGLFEAEYTTRVARLEFVKPPLKFFGILNKNLAYVKD